MINIKRAFPPVFFEAPDSSGEAGTAQEMPAGALRAIDIIERVDEREPNNFDTAQKLRWLSQLDGQIESELGDTDSFKRGPYKDGSEQLLLPFSLGEELYCHYLTAQINAANGEAERYNRSISLFNTEYEAYMSSRLRQGLGRDCGGFRF